MLHTRTNGRMAGCALALAAVLIMAAGCSDGDAGGDGGDGVGSSDEQRDNVLRITESDYRFELDGELRAGAVTIEVDNQGQEIHDLAMFRLRDGKTMDDVRAALAKGGDEDPLEDVAVADSSIDDLGGTQFPGTRYSISGAGVEAGTYALVCLLPGHDGKSHAELGMVTGFTVGSGNVTTRPRADVTYTVTDKGLEGPAELPAGPTTIDVVNDSSTTREITLVRLADGKTVDDVLAFFASSGEGPPDPAAAPFDFFGFVYDAEQDRSISVDLRSGQWIMGVQDPDHQSEPSADDPFTKLIRVS